MEVFTGDGVTKEFILDSDFVISDNSVYQYIVNGKIVWNKDESFKEKEALAANKLADSIKAWREAHPGRRNNEELIKHVHDFYKDVK